MRPVKRIISIVAEKFMHPLTDLLFKQSVEVTVNA
jgi:hypothetical protein